MLKGRGNRKVLLCASIDVRQLLYGRKPHVHRILFTIDGEMVNILHIRHGRRKSLSEH